VIAQQIFGQDEEGAARISVKWICQRRTTKVLPKKIKQTRLIQLHRSSLVQIAFDRFAVGPDGLTHGRGRRSRWREQRFDETPGLGGVQLDLVALGDNLPGHFQRVDGDKLGQRAAFNGGCLTEKLFVRRGYPGDESLAFPFFQCGRHAANVCLRGTQIKSQFSCKVLRQ